MIYDYCKLRGKIVEKFTTMQRFAKAMNWSERTLSLKMNNKRYWKQTEIINACNLLEISNNQIVEYFFNQLVQ